ncbi:protein kinase domain-containing protein [Uliginosibacterium gangwonense]|uniref:protein kinase domain-containing protein n=1 Tax=Uliginosibacterium gangwonense TaxID=392736 RepID=UPI000378C515|nr:protein kinase [Uliginosibacterium gangwonense]
MAASSAPQYHRICPGCGQSNAPQVLRCACGTLLNGVDLVCMEPAPSPDTIIAPPVTETGVIRCPYEDCAQDNPAGGDTCVYCNRPLTRVEEETSSLIQLPASLAEHYRILRPLPTRGAEAELFVLEALGTAQPVVLKLYRSGILPKPEIQALLAQINPRSCIQVLASGQTSGHAYEIMEYCAHGSLRERMPGTPMAASQIKAIIEQMGMALADTHANNIVHRDIKPENILIRSETPLDLVLTDFGIASVLAASQCFTGMARTLMYAAPESLAGVLDTKADYWSLGMILLECALGQHPFAGLSDTVILHALCTRSMDLSAVADIRLRMLLHGLLLRNPKQRWGAEELARWLANDITLTEPVEHGTFADAHSYRIGADICHSPEQLAVALARNWQAGVSDIQNGQLQAWFRDMQKDHNTVRLLIENKHEHPLPPDMQLLRLILHLAPGIPPVWRGQSVEPRAILHHAAQALKGDASATQWLFRIYEARVPQAYAEAGNVEMAELVERWYGACDQFAALWKMHIELLQQTDTAGDPQEPRRFEQAMYGNMHLQHPPMQALLPNLLALSYDRKWTAHLRQHISAKMAPLLVSSPWLAKLGNPASMEAEMLLVIDALLPEARKAAARIEAAEKARRETLAEEFHALAEAAGFIQGRLRRHVDARMMSNEFCDVLREELDEFDRILAGVRSHGGSDAKEQDLRKRLARIEPIAIRLRQHIDRYGERQLITAGWLSLDSAAFVLLAIIVLPILIGGSVLLMMLAACVAIALWRLAPAFLIMRKVRALIEQI